MEFMFYTVIVAIIMSYIYIFRFNKTKLMLTEEESKIYTKYIHSSLAIFLIGFTLSFIVDIFIVDILYFAALVMVLGADFYVWQKLSNEK